MRNRVYKTFLFLFLNLINISVFSQEHTNLSKAAEKLALDFSNAVIEQVIVADNITKDDRLKIILKLVDVVLEDFYIARFILGRYYKTLAKHKFQTFQQKIEILLAYQFARVLQRYKNETLVIDFVEVNDTKTQYSITQSLQDPDTGNIVLSFQLIALHSPNGLKLIDLNFAGASLLHTYRSEINRILAQNNGDIDILIQEINLRIDATYQTITFKP